MKFINQIDEYFYNKPVKELVTFSVILVLSVGFVIYYFIYPGIEKFSDREIDKGEKLQRQISSLINQKRAYSNNIQKLNKNIKSLNLEKTSLKKQKEFYEELVNLLDFAEFNKNKWGEFIKNIVIDAKNEGLIVKGFNNKLYNENEKLINKKMDISIKLTGEFKNLIYFIYEYENTKNLLRVNSLKADQSKNYELNISLYGYSK